MNISVLCKVVDNFGDIGVVWRMVRQLKKKNPDVEINLIVDDLASFNKIWKNVCVEKSFQIIDGINVYLWNDYQLCHEEFSKNDGEKLQIILECFQCGRPDWMEKILFEEKLQRTVQIIMIDYLTAEKYAEDFHCLQSLTRSAKVQKVNFMPGFTDKTGGLVIDRQWENFSERNSDGPILLFTYENDWTELAEALGEANVSSEILIAQGRGRGSLEEAFNKTSLNNIRVLDYLSQNEWDELMKNCSILFIRGEESMSRACLSGIPFVWHAYPQSDEYQLVKVNALLDRLNQYFTEEDFQIIKRVWLCFNNPVSERKQNEMSESVKKFVKNADRLVAGFANFAKDLRKNGDLCDNLMTFIRKLTII